MNNLEKSHARLSASGADRWINCPGSIMAEEQVTEVDSNRGVADEGTLAHELADRCLKNNYDAERFANVKIGNLDITLPTMSSEYKIEYDMVNYIQDYVDYVRSYMNEDTQLLTELKVDYSNVTEGGFGTVDSAIVDFRSRVCHIFDFKYGRVFVSPENNYQCMMYAIGLLNILKELNDVDKFRIHICQPRKANFLYWDISVEDIIMFSEYAKERAKLALSDNPPRIAGKHCIWCKAKGNCAVAWGKVEEYMGIDVNDIKVCNADNLTISKKELIVQNRKFIEAMLDDVGQSLYKDLLAGIKSDKFKLVRSVPNRKLKEDAEAQIVAMLGDQAYNKKILGLGDLEKKLSKKVVSELTYRPEGGIVLADRSDKRDEVTDTDLLLLNTNSVVFED